MGERMNFPELEPILEKLVSKYRDVRFSEWEKLFGEGESCHDYSEDDPESKFFWQAHTHILEIDVNDMGRYAHISTTVYPWDVHSSLPPQAQECWYMNPDYVISARHGVTIFMIKKLVLREVSPRLGL